MVNLKRNLNIGGIIMAKKGKCKDCRYLTISGGIYICRRDTKATLPDYECRNNGFAKK